MLLLLLACTGGEDTADPCAGAPVVTWESFGEALLVEHCQPCHASTSANRFGAPIEVTFDTHEQAVALRDDLLRVATGDAPTMPPVITIGETDEELLRIWLTCYE